MENKACSVNKSRKPRDREFHRVRKHPMDRRFKSVASALALEVLLALKGDVPARIRDSLVKGNFLDVVSSSCDPLQFEDSQAFADAYLAVEIMSKFPCWDIGIDKTASAYAKFYEAETSCTATNQRFVRDRMYVNGALSPYTPESILLMAREKIQRLLGPFSWDLAERHFGFGPGATTSLNHRLGDAYYKYREKPCTTSANAVLALTCISRKSPWFRHVVDISGKTLEEVELMDVSEKIRTLFRITPGNRVITVPKNAKTERIIAIEPTMNSYVQKGIGGLIRSRLKRLRDPQGYYICNLDDQERNQLLAKEGSIDGLLATIDLSSASDSVSMELVDALLPPDWVIAIKQARSPVGVLPSGETVVYQKVSSMGNGFTFELESLIFWALSSSVASLLRPIDHRMSIYGDDIIVPVSICPTLIWVLNYCGFTCNMKKTFTAGPFRESCGKHYFRGTDVTPLYIRKDIDTPERVIWFCNQIRRYSRLCYGLDARFLPAYLAGVSLLPGSLRRPTIPDGLGDLALFGDFDEALPHKAKHGFCGWQARIHFRTCPAGPRGGNPYLCRSLDRVGIAVEEIQQFMDRIKTIHKAGDVVFSNNGGVKTLEKEKWVSKTIPVVQWVSHGPWLG